MLIGLHDVHFIMGMRIRGTSIGRTLDEYVAGKKVAKTKIINNAAADLGLVPEKGGCSHDKLKKKAKTDSEMDNATKGAAYLLFLVGTILCPDKSQNLIPFKYWDYVKDLNKVEASSWGSFLLAMVYRDLGILVGLTRTDIDKVNMKM